MRRGPSHSITASFVLLSSCHGRRHGGVKPSAIRNELPGRWSSKAENSLHVRPSLSQRSFNSLEAGLHTSADLLCSKLRRRQLRRSGLIIIRADVSQASLRAFKRLRRQTKEAASTKWVAKEKTKNKNCDGP